MVIFLLPRISPTSKSALPIEGELELTTLRLLNTSTVKVSCVPNSYSIKKCFVHRGFVFRSILRVVKCERNNKYEGHATLRDQNAFNAPGGMSKILERGYKWDHYIFIFIFTFVKRIHTYISVLPRLFASPRAYRGGLISTWAKVSGDCLRALLRVKFTACKLSWSLVTGAVGDSRPFSTIPAILVSSRS